MKKNTNSSNSGRPSRPSVDPKEAGYPSTTGNPSGDGRGNNLPKSSK